MINDLATLARVRQTEIRNAAAAREMLPRYPHTELGLARRLLRPAAARLGSALVSVGRRLELSVMMEESPQHGS